MTKVDTEGVPVKGTMTSSACIRHPRWQSLILRWIHSALLDHRQL